MHGQVLCCVGGHISPPLPCSDGWVTKHLQKDRIRKLQHKRAFHEIYLNMKQNPVQDGVTRLGSAQLGVPRHQRLLPILTHSDAAADFPVRFAVTQLGFFTVV